MKKNIIKEVFKKQFAKEDIKNMIINNVQTKKINYFKLTLIPISLVIVISIILFNPSKNFKPVNDESKTNAYNDKQCQEFGDTKVTIQINEMQKDGAYFLSYNIIPLNDINYPWPDAIKDGITLPDDLTKTNYTALYAQNEDNKEYLNNYRYVYYNEDIENYRSIIMSFSKDYLPAKEDFFKEGDKISYINNFSLKIYQDNNHYFTEFTYKNTNFSIKTTNITEKEFITFLLSIIK